MNDISVIIACMHVIIVIIIVMIIVIFISSSSSSIHTVVGRSIAGLGLDAPARSALIGKRDVTFTRKPLYSTTRLMQMFLHK